MVKIRTLNSNALFLPNNIQGSKKGGFGLTLGTVSPARLKILRLSQKSKISGVLRNLQSKFLGHRKSQRFPRVSKIRRIFKHGKKIKCECGGIFKPAVDLSEGFVATCFRCNKCKDEIYSPEQMKEIARLREINKEINGKRKIIKVGDSIAALLPKKIKKYGVKEGIVDEVKVLSPRSLEIRFDKDYF